jgi:hypothetical protein
MSHFEALMAHDIGIETVMWGRDYPHEEGTWPYTRQSMRMTFAGIDEADARLLIGENAARAYDVDVAALSELAARIGPRPSEIDVPLPKEEIPTDYSSLSFRETGRWS